MTESLLPDSAGQLVDPPCSNRSFHRAEIVRRLSASFGFRSTASAVFSGAVLLHIAIWTLLPILLLPNASLDMIEGLAWGREWQLGYEKDPPLFAWVIEAVTELSGYGLWTAYLAAQLCIATVFVSVWNLGRRLMSDNEALVAALLLEGIFFFNFPTPEFNDIVLQMPFAAALGWFLYVALREGRMRDWILAGFAASGGLWARYSMGAYILPLVFFVMLHPQARRCLRTPGPWVASLVGTLAFLPHLYWIVQSDFISLRYVDQRAEELHGVLGMFTGSLRFIAGQLLAFIPAGLAAGALQHWRGREAVRALDLGSFDNAYLTVLALGPVLTSLAISLLSGRQLHSMWGAPLWCFITLFGLLLIRPVLTGERLRRFGTMWLGMLLLPALVFALLHLFGPLVTKHEKRANFPGNRLAEVVTDRWHAVNGAPLRYVVGDTWLAGNVAFYSKDRPSVFTEGDIRLSPWINPLDVSRFGAVLVWNADRFGNGLPPKFAAAYPKAAIQPLFSFEGQRRIHHLGIAFVQPTGRSPVQGGD